MNEKLSMKRKVSGFLLGIGVGCVVLALFAVALFQIPSVQDRYGWRVDFALTFLRSLVDPVKPLPAIRTTRILDDQLKIKPTDPPVETRIQQATQQTNVTTSSPTPLPTPTLAPTPIPGVVQLAPPAYEKQEINNCGPATLAMYLRYYGWEGDQATIASITKPKSEDRNVNVEELVAYVNTQTPGFEIQFRVGGDVETLKRLLAAGLPVMIEESFIMEESYWLNDDRWAGHYLLLTGYDDNLQAFQVQDSFLGPNMQIPYATLKERWKSFNYVYVLVYKPESRPLVQSLLADQWDVETNRKHALELAKQEAEQEPGDAFAWFNVGTNLVYFESYAQAAGAYDNARNIGLPQRMLRYQFGPFFAYFHSGRIEDLLSLTEYALKRTPNSEEAKLWRGWAMYRQGNKEEAIKLFNEALAVRPDYFDAEYALDFVRNN